MSRPPSLRIELDITPAPDPTQSSQPQSPNSLTPSPSPRRERPPLRSSPLAGPSYASDGAGGIVERSSALGEEIARRKSLLVAGLDDTELARLASLSHSPTTSVEIVPPVPSRQNSSDSSTADSHGIPKRKARPSFISLASPSSPSHPSAHLPAPTPTLRNRHSSPNIARSASLDAPSPSPPLPTTPSSDKDANWMTSAPAPSFSRTSIHARGVVLPVKAASKGGQRIRRKSMPSAPASHFRMQQAPVPPLPVPVAPRQITKADTENESEIEGRGQGQTIRSKKSTRSLRSVRSLFRHEHEEKEKDLPPVPPLPYSRSRASSISGASVQMPSTPPDSTAFPSITSPRLATQVPNLTLDDHHEIREGKVKRLWTRVIHGVKKMK